VGCNTFDPPFSPFHSYPSFTRTLFMQDLWQLKQKRHAQTFLYPVHASFRDQWIAAMAKQGRGNGGEICLLCQFG
jgi:hypothetical protein